MARFKLLLRYTLSVVLLLSLFGTSYAFPGGKKFKASNDDAPYTTISQIQSNIAHSVVEISKVLQDLSLVAGIGFILSSFFKFHQHKLQPTQVPLSQGLSLLIVGGCLTMFPLIIPTAGVSIFGTGAGVSKVSGSAISKLIGS